MTFDQRGRKWGCVDLSWFFVFLAARCPSQRKIVLFLNLKQGIFVVHSKKTSDTMLGLVARPFE
jgi:hypothetical protein